VKPLKPESKTRMLGSGLISGGHGGDGGAVGRGIGAGEVGVTGESVAGLTVDEEADLGEVGKGSVQGSDDGEEGEVFGLHAGWVGVGEGAVEVDDGKLAAAEDGVGGEGVGPAGGEARAGDG